MSRLGLFVLCATLSSLVVLGKGDMSTQEPVTIDISKHPSSEANVTHKTTATDPTTTTEPTTAIKPNTTTSTTTTTTIKPNTTTTSTTTTTVAPPTPPPTPKPTPPGPLPPPDQGTWAYTENNVTCIVVQFAAQLNVTYTKAVDNSTILANVLLNVPSNASVVGSCNSGNKTEQWLTLSWPAGSSINHLTLIFRRNITTKNYALHNLNISLAPEIFPNASFKNPVELSHGTEWQTPLSTSYRCAAPTRLNMTAESTSVVAALTLSRLQEEAFRTSPGKAFSAARECGGRDVPDAVPIAVGCALGGLVVVVLIAYLVGRRRSAARGYVSM